MDIAPDANEPKLLVATTRVSCVKERRRARNVTAGEEILFSLFILLVIIDVRREEFSDKKREGKTYLQSVSSDSRAHLQRPHRFHDIVFKKRERKRDIITRRAFGREGVQQLGNESSRLLLVSQHTKLMLYDHASNLFLQLPGVYSPPLSLSLSLFFPPVSRFTLSDGNFGFNRK